MDPKVKQMPSGQVEQENYEPGGVDLPNEHSETGPELGLGFTVGKSGSVDSIGLPQTDVTAQNGGGSIDGAM